MRVLLDTNIVIPREGNEATPPEIQELSRLLGACGHTIVVHPASAQDLSRGKDKGRKKLMLAKLGNYTKLELPPDPDGDVQFWGSIYEDGNPHLNHILDDRILYAVCRHAVSFLITEDAFLRRKAERLGLRSRVLSVDEGLQRFRQDLPDLNLESPPAVKHRPIHNLNLDDPFFNSLKEDYGSEAFSEWFQRCCEEGRRAIYHLRDDGSLGALMVYKIEEDEAIGTPLLPRKRRFKISTIKVAHRGYKLGELFLKQAFKLALNNGHDEVYLTVFADKHPHLVELIETYGFYDSGSLTTLGENIYCKDIQPPVITTGLEAVEDLNQRYFPAFYHGPFVGKFVIPIRPEFHNRLFLDGQQVLESYANDLVVEGNTIKKAYLTRSPIRRLRRNDLVFFYQSQKHRGIRQMGIVEEVHFHLEDFEEIWRLIDRRTVYTKAEVRGMLAKGAVTIILFRHPLPMKTRVPLEKLKNRLVLKGPPQSVTQISHEAYLTLNELGGIDERLTINQAKVRRGHSGR